MTPERAREIVAAIADRSFMAMGISDKSPSLEGVSLVDMLEAATVVEQANREAKTVDGMRTFHVVPDDRLIAAVYALEHYDSYGQWIAAKIDGTTTRVLRVVLMPEPTHV